MKKAKSMRHPTLSLRVAIDQAAYRYVDVKCPEIKTSRVDVVTDTGAQSCLWGFQDFYRHGFK